MANVLVTVESLIGMAGIAVAAGLVFARVAIPTTKIMFSRSAIITSEGQQPSFKFRLVNGALSELIDARVRVIIAKTDVQYGMRTRRFHELNLERPGIAFFPLDWTVVHHITEDSPLHSITPQQLEQGKTEILVLVNAIDDASSQAVHARSSYRWDEVEWNMRYRDMFRRTPAGRMTVDLKLLDATEPADNRSAENLTVWDT